MNRYASTLPGHGPAGVRAGAGVVPLQHRVAGVADGQRERVAVGLRLAHLNLDLTAEQQVDAAIDTHRIGEFEVTGDSGQVGVVVLPGVGQLVDG
jgi:hypothetical protein